MYSYGQTVDEIPVQGFELQTTVNFTFVDGPGSIWPVFYGITSSPISFYSNFDGCIGFEPQSNFNTESNFLYELKQNRTIDHYIIAFYTSHVGQKSYVKVGSVDTNAFRY